MTVLEIYDVLGRAVETLDLGEQAAGKHSFEFNGSNLSSGVYFYRLSSGDLIETKKMLLVK